MLGGGGGDLKKVKRVFDIEQFYLVALNLSLVNVKKSNCLLLL